MTTTKYSIPGIHARSILSTARKIEDGFHFSFDASDPSKEHLVTYTQQADCPIFYQAMLALGKRPTATNPSNALQEVFVFIDFSGIFDRPSTGRTAEMQEMAEHLFRPEGIVLNFGGADHRYIAFERSASMSRQSRMCFVREDVYLPLRERMMLGMTIGKCQLAKLYAYNGLLFTDGRRFDSPSLLSDSHIVVIDNPKTIIKNARIITVEDDGTGEAMRKYHRVEKDADVEITEFDGEGLISSELAKKMDDTEDHLHHSFQIRLPYIKGVVHEVDYKKLFRSMRLRYITDIWGKQHNIQEVDMILTRSMFKGFGWMTENGLTWAAYLERCRKYDHALYISGMDKIQEQDTTELNYQFLNTLDISNDAFRPGDLPLGWNRKPDTDNRQWVTKTMESAYYALVGDPVSQQKYFLKNIDAIADRRRRARAEIVRKNPLFLNEPIYSKELSSKAESLLADYSAGHLLVSGDNRYLSDDLMRLLAFIVKTSGGNITALEKECLSGNTIYAPQPGYPVCNAYTLLRSPHIARNEEAAVVPLAKVGKIRSRYLSHLHYVVMVDSRSLIPERLGGADFDGDMVKTIADPLLNQCIQKHNSLPVLKIPTAQPILADANDWYARFQTVKSTFSSRVGQISNAALRRGIIAYDEKADEEIRNAAREDTETLAILTGLEIDSAKSGIKPDLSEYLHSSGRQSSLFLRYKSITEDDKKRSWYEPTKNKRLQQYFSDTDWAAVGSNLEKLPYYAYSLGQETRKVEFTPVPDKALFSFASELNWKNTLNPEIMGRMASLIADYEEAQRRVRFLRHSPEAMKRRSDIDRILFARGQENEYSTDTLYALFDLETPDRIHHARLQLTQQQWHLMPPEARKDFLFELFPTGSIDAYADIFCDFRCGGYRILGDILCDLDELHQNRQIQKHYLAKKGDSETLQFLLAGISDYGDYKAELVKRCIAVLQPSTARDRFDFEEAVKCTVVLDKRNFVMEVLPASALPLVLDKSTPEPQKKRKGLLRR